MESQNGRDSALTEVGDKKDHCSPAPAASLPIFLLAVAGGGLDAMIILAFNVLTAAQTGNTILMATSIASGDFPNGLESAVSLTAFMAGVMAGSRLTPPSAVHPPGTARRAGFTWLAYFAGATICGMLFPRMGPVTLVIPRVCVGLFIVHHQTQPQTASKQKRET